MHFTIKPVSFTCNLVCDYCFYLPKGNDMLQRATMSDEVLESFIKKYIEISDNHVFFTWQGGEPLLCPISFYEKAFKLQQKYAKGRIIENAIQTNGTLINEEWAKFFHDNKVLIGISIDGPAEYHDVYRKDRHNEGSFKQVLQGIELLKKYKVEFNTLTCVNKSNQDHPLEVYHFLKSLGVKFMQFSEVVETTPENADFDNIPVQYKAKEFSVEPQAYGKFMATIFKEWVRQDIGDIVIRQFETFIAAMHGGGHISCVWENKCPDNFVLEANGDIYECDQAVYSKYKIGNILDSDLTKLASSQINHRKQELSKICQECIYLPLCNGGCPKHRINLVDGVPSTYFCEGYKVLLATMVPYLNAMVSLTSNNIPFTQVKTFADKIEQALEQDKAQEAK